MKVKQFLTLLAFKILAAFVSIGIPAWFIYAKLFSGEVKVEPIIDVGIALMGVLMLLVWSGWLKAKFYRKLQSVDVVEELGQTPQTNFVMVRLLKSIEYVFPFVIIAFLVKGIASVWPVEVIYQPFFWLLYCLAAGVVIMIIHDGFKTHFTNINLIDRNLAMKNKVEQLENKRERQLTLKSK